MGCNCNAPAESAHFFRMMTFFLFFNYSGDLIPVFSGVLQFSWEVTADSHLVRVVKPLSVALNWSQILVPEHKQRGRDEAAGRRDGR